MKKILLSIFLILFSISSAQAFSQFCNGFQAGYKSGYKQARNTSMDPMPPMCPMQVRNITLTKTVTT